MAPGLTLFLSIIATVGFFAIFYGGIFTILGLKNRGASPHLGVRSTGEKGTLGVWVQWDPSTYLAQFWRLRVSFFSPDSVEKDGHVTYTFDPPQKTSFLQVIRLPSPIIQLLEDRTQKGIIRIDARSAEGLVIGNDFSVASLRRCLGKTPKALSKGITEFPAVDMDPPAVTSLDFSELTVRKQKLKNLSQQAKAKAAAAKPAPPPGGTSSATAPKKENPPIASSGISQAKVVEKS